MSRGGAEDGREKAGAEEVRWRYEASDITVLDARETIRRRPGMYVGTTGRRGLHQMVFQVMGRAVDEVLAGRAGTVDVVLGPGGEVSVADDGPGVPVEVAEDGDGLETLLTRTAARPKPPGRHCAVLERAGFGPFVANVLSSSLTAEVRRDGVRWVQEYERGGAIAPPTVVGPAAGTGTTLSFRPDPEIFPTTECSFAALADSFRELAFLNRDLEISLTDARSPGEQQSVRFRFPYGLRDFVVFLDSPHGHDDPDAPARTPLHPDVIAFAREDPRIEGTAEVALRWCSSPDERIRSFANSAPTRNGGAHLAGFRDGLALAVNAFARERRLLSAADPDLGGDRIGQGLTAVVSVKVDHPCFEDPVHGTLGNAEVRACVREAVREHVGRWAEEHADRAAAVVGRIVGVSGRAG
ncbi:DNA gyrase subunit B [Streptomyces sp. NPDC093221]|uniref:DNA gyrase subunit B n=1 Tax=Streptomyces sp. NPDC093221 TaxID=3366032 RepID=UPI00380433FB